MCTHLIAGLLNFGHTCYANALLQALASCPSFVKQLKFLTNLRKSFCPSTSELAIYSDKQQLFLYKLPLVFGLLDCLQRLQPILIINGAESLTASSLEFLQLLAKHKNSSIQFDEQQDVCETFEIVLDCISHELDTLIQLLDSPFSTNKKNYSKILQVLENKEQRQKDETEIIGSNSIFFPRVLFNTAEGMKTLEHSSLHKVQVSNIIRKGPCEGLNAYSLECEECGYTFATQYDSFTTLMVPIISPLSSDDNEVISLEECLDETFKEDTAGPIVCPNCSLLKTLFCEINPGKEYLDIEDFKYVHDMYVKKENKKLSVDVICNGDEDSNNRNISNASSPGYMIYKRQTTSNLFRCVAKSSSLETIDYYNDDFYNSFDYKKESKDIAIDILKNINPSNNNGSKSITFYKKCLENASIKWKTVKSHVKRKTSLGKGPQVLVIAVQRKVYDGFSYIKLKDRVCYPNKLSLKKYFLYPSIHSTEYELKSIIIHHGNADTGHYLAVRKIEISSNDKYQTQWMLASDDKVYPISEEAAFGMECSMLFYERISNKE